MRATTPDGARFPARKCASSRHQWRLIVTNASGAFTTALATGRHLVEVSKPGYKSGDEIAIVDRDRISVALIPMGSWWWMEHSHEYGRGAIPAHGAA